MRHSDIQRQGATYQLVDPAIGPVAPPWLFDPQALHARGLIVAESHGRRPVWFLEHGAERLVLRHYWRGGMIAVLSDDVYLWTGVERSRPVREFRLLRVLRETGLPVPIPIAARVERVGRLRYRGDLVTAVIPGARPLAECLLDHGEDHALWRSVGEIVARFHRHGADHADLNVRNILVDGYGTVWLIDWDRGRLGRPFRSLSGNIRRLRRSLSREPELEALANAHWPTLEQAYRRALGA